MEWLSPLFSGGYSRWEPRQTTYRGSGDNAKNQSEQYTCETPKQHGSRKRVFIVIAFLMALFGFIIWLIYGKYHSVESSSNFKRVAPQSINIKSHEQNPSEAPLHAIQAWPDDPTTQTEGSIDKVIDEFDDTGYYGSDDNASIICAGWCPSQYLDKLDCERHGLERLKTAFQIENCEAALDSTQAKFVGEKIVKVSESTVFTFFRGAAAYFDYNMMCSDSDFRDKMTSMPRVYSNGDCHPENFGVMVQASNNVEKNSDTGDLVWGVNDFDQSFLTPFSWDLKRGAVGFALGIHDRGWAIGDVARISWAFINFYITTITARKDCGYLNQERFIEGSDYVNHSAPVIQSLFDKARKRDSRSKTLKWLSDKMGVDVKKERFVLIEDRGIYPLDDKLLPEFQQSIDAWLYHGVAALTKFSNINGFYDVVSVAEKRDSGTGSVGLKRYWLLIKGRYKEPHGRIILEMKQSVNSVLEVFFHYKFTKSQEGKRAVDAVRSSWPYTNLFYGWTTLGEDTFIVRERSKHHVSVDIESLTKEEYLEYAENAGRALAFYHIRSRCPNYECLLSEESAVDKEICESIQDYLQRFGVEKFKRYVYKFSSHEYVRQNNAFELLNKFVNYRKANSKSSTDWRLDILVGPKPIGQICNESNIATERFSSPS